MQTKKGVLRMKKQTLVVCLSVLLAGCGSGGMSSTQNNVMMQGGQWEYVVVPENGTIPMYVEMNLPATNGTLSATNGQIFQPSEVGIPDQSGPIYCADFDVNGTIADSTLSGKLSWGQPSDHFGNFSGQLAADGQSLSNGTYQGEVCVNGTNPKSGGAQVKGNLVGYTVAPVNGTFTGTLNSSLYGADVVTLSITQNPDFSLSVVGTSVENGVSTPLIPSTFTQSNIVLGATVYLAGSATNINGSEPFTIAGHLNPSATQLTIAYMNFGPNETVTGALTKQ
jgi:hypothetical protein